MFGKNKGSQKAAIFAQSVKIAGVGRALVGLAVSILLLVLSIAGCVYMASKGISWIAGATLVSIFSIVAFIELIRLKRAYSVSIVPNLESNIRVEEGEKILGYIGGVLRTGKRAVSYSVLGVGKNYAPQNCIILTNKNLWVFALPLKGTGKVVSGIDIGRWQWLTMAGEINDKLESMVSSMTLGKLLGSCLNVFRIPVDKIENFTISSANNLISFKAKGTKYYFTLRYSQDMAKVGQLFKRMPGA